MTDRQLADAFATLTEQEREAIRLFVLEGLDTSSAAKVAGCSPGAFAVRLSRARKRLRAALGAGIAAAVLAAVLVFAPGDGDGGSVIERAAQASEPDGGSIVKVVSEVDVRSTGTLHQRKTTWVRVDSDGKPADVRSLITAVSGGTSRAGVEDVTTTTPRGRVLAQFDPATGKVTTTQNGWQEPSLLFRAHALLSAAERGNKVAKLDGEETFAGRRAYRVIVTGVEEPARGGDRDVLLIDAETYAPLALRKHSEGKDVNGKPFTYDLTERVVEQRTLPDNEKNRALLRMHGPSR